MKSVEIKIKLQSAVVNTFIWYGNSEPDDVDDVFDDAKDHALYPGFLSLWPLRELNPIFLSPLSSSWYLNGDLSELNEQPLKDIFDSQKIVNQVIEVESGEIDYELEEYDWDGFEGDFHYRLTGEISLSLLVPNDARIREEIRDFIYKNLCFVGDVTSSRFEHTSAEGENIKIEAKEYLILPISQFELEDGHIDYKIAPSFDEVDESKLRGLINWDLT